MAGFGEALRRAREERGLSLAEVERATRIRARHLAALENEDLSGLSPVYSRGFLRTYARFLGLDAEELLARYPEPAEPPLPSLPSPPRLRPQISGGYGLVVGLIIALASAMGLYMYWGSQDFFSSAKEGVDLRVTPTSGGKMVNVTPVSGDTSVPTAPPASSAIPSPSVTPEMTPTPSDTPTPSGTPTATPTVAPTATALPPSPTPSTVAVPSLVGARFEDAQRSLLDGGLRVSRRDEYNASYPAGVVAAQDPAPGAASERGAVVTLVVSRGPTGVTVPNVMGMPEDQAKSALTAAGLKVSPYVNYQGHESLPDEILSNVCVGCVLSTTPSGGNVVPPGTEVAIAVRKD